MTEVIQIEDRFYILAGSGKADGRTMVLKHDDTFGIFNAFGDIEPHAHEAQGVFTRDMRYLSRLQTRINGSRLLLLSSRVTEDNTRLIVDLTNPDIMDDRGHIALARGTIHLLRTTFLFADACYQQLTLTNFSLENVELELALDFDSDFADIFEIRGTPRDMRGELLQPEQGENWQTLGYLGLDEIIRFARFDFTPKPTHLSPRSATFRTRLAPRKRAKFFFTLRCEPSEAMRSELFDANAARLSREVQQEYERFCKVSSSSRRLTQWLQRAYADIRTLTTQMPEGSYPYAGVPWYNTPFGRDGIITALQLLWVDPTIARGVLAYLADTQADEIDPRRDAEPGKILHERRAGEMANIGEVPFGRYYGSVDATPLFIVLAGEYYEHTGDLDLIRSIWPNIVLALDWIDRYGNLLGDGYISYQAKSDQGLTNQGWKDSHDSVFHADGSLAQTPIALCEVQGYAYDAKLHAAKLAGVMGDAEMAQRLTNEAEKLKRNFNKDFWSEQLGTFGIALDGRRRLCEVRTSNPGHCLYSGIADPELGRQVCRSLMERTMHSGWGVRTVASTEARYNPMSYHNGSVWPHDNAIIAAGMVRYGCIEEPLRIFNSWLDASTYLDLHRLPELFCGFRRRPGKGPTLYPVACSPHAWASGAVFMMLSAILGLKIDGINRQIHFHRPHLPRDVDELYMANLRIGDASIDLRLHKERRDVGVLVVRKEGPIDLVVTK